MKNRLIFAVIFITFAITLSVVSFVVLKTNVIKIIDSADSLIYALNEDKEPEYYYKKLHDLWDKYDNFFGIVIKHQDADILEKYFLLIEECKKTKDYEKLISTLTEMKCFLKVCLEGEKIKIENVF